MKILRFLSVIALMSPSFFVACEEAEKEIAVASIAISQSSAEMEIGETLTLKATVSPSNATYDGMTWTSTNPKVASASASGLVTALSEGNTTITVMAGGKTAICSITVVKGYVAVTSISLNKTTLELVEDDTETLIATVSPDDAADKTVSWTSSNEEIATVKDGTITAVKEGEATIFAKAGEKTASCKVIVSKKVIDVESIELNRNELTIVEGESETLVATVKPDNATDKTVSWSSADESVAMVSVSGVVTAIKEGETIVTATSGAKSASCKVIVQKEIIDVTSISLDQNTLELYEGTSATLSATVLPENATDKTITWSSSNTTVATVDSNGKVEAISSGSATITATAGGFSASCTVTVIVPVASISLNKTELTLKIKESESLVATISPSNATNKSVTWKSDNTNVATVNNDGKVTAVDQGTAKITVTTQEGSKTATCVVTVLPSGNTETINDDGQEHNWD